MTEQPSDNVILFPKTVEYYQFELTRLLETEKFGEAIRTLRFLLACQTDDTRAREEWQSLLDWLQLMFPDLPNAEPDEPEEDPDEAELLKKHLHAKAELAPDYADKLMQSLFEQKSADKQLLALDQLAFIEHPGINDALIRFLTEKPLPSIIQFRTLQTLKKRGAEGSVVLDKNGEKAEINIEETPADFDQFPCQIQDIIVRVREISETQNPALSYFAEQTWNEFLAFIYGTSSYRQMLKQDAACVDVWACALHLTLLERVFDGGGKEELFELYGITSDLIFQWEQAYRIMQQFAQAVFSGYS